jgi:hypothetical protein
VAQHLYAYRAFAGCTPEARRAILAQACLVLWHPTGRHRAGSCESLNRTLLMVFVTDTRQQVLVAFERGVSSCHPRHDETQEVMWLTGLIARKIRGMSLGKNCKRRPYARRSGGVVTLLKVSVRTAKAPFPLTN